MAKQSQNSNATAVRREPGGSGPSGSIFFTNVSPRRDWGRRKKRQYGTRRPATAYAS